VTSTIQAKEVSVNPSEKLVRVWAAFALLLICWSRSALACHNVSPIVFDLNGDGISTSNVLTSPVPFDMDGDGTAEQIGWTSQYDQDGFLWLDQNHNDAVDSGVELFGSATRLSDGSVAPNGFAALAEYDTFAMGGNADGEITSADAIYSFLNVWTDTNHDGVFDAGENHSLAARGIAVISLDYGESDLVDGCMNRHRFKSRFIIRDQKRSVSRESHDIYFHVLHTD
jgi:hypothetical protein